MMNSDMFVLTSRKACQLSVHAGYLKRATQRTYLRAYLNTTKTCHKEWTSCTFKVDITYINEIPFLCLCHGIYILG